MAFDFYFTGVPAHSEIATFLLEKNACVLLSQLNERNNIYKWIEVLKNSSHKCKLFIDSGAFSAWTKGKEIDVEEYINFINTNKEYLTVCASVDNIPGKPRSATVASVEEVAASAQKTWDNFLYMRSKMEDKSKLLYTFHCGEPWEFLERALSYKDEFGSLSYIAFGGLVGKTESIIKTFLEKAFQLVSKSDNPHIRIHAFGMTRLKFLEEYPFTSADSTSWLQVANYGNILIGSKTVCLSDRKLLSDDHVLNKNEALKEDVIEIIEKYGTTIESLSTNSNERLLFNVKVTQEWADNYRFNSSSLFKPELF